MKTVGGRSPRAQAIVTSKTQKMRTVLLVVLCVFRPEALRLRSESRSRGVSTAEASGGSSTTALMATGGALIDHRGFLRDAYPVIDYDDEEELMETRIREEEALKRKKKVKEEEDESLETLTATREKKSTTLGVVRCYMRARQVPGDGSCLFHALSAGLWLAINGTHHPMERKFLRAQSFFLRQTAVDVLENRRDASLYMGDGEKLKASQLLQLAAEQQGQTPSEYCAKVREPQAWGGGPEIVALANALRRPIHVYELVWACAREEVNSQKSNDDARWCVRCIAEFGSPRFDRRHAPLHVLSCDSRFPNLAAENMLDQGNHFLLLFECEPELTKKVALEAGFQEDFAENLAVDAKRRRERRMKDLKRHELLRKRIAEKKRKLLRKQGDTGGVLAFDEPFIADLDLSTKFVDAQLSPTQSNGFFGFATRKLLPSALVAWALVLCFPMVDKHLPRPACLTSLRGLDNDFFFKRPLRFLSKLRPSKNDSLVADDELSFNQNNTEDTILQDEDKTSEPAPLPPPPPPPPEKKKEDEPDSYTPGDIGSTDAEPPSASNTSDTPASRLRRRLLPGGRKE